MIKAIVEDTIEAVYCSRLWDRRHIECAFCPAASDCGTFEPHIMFNDVSVLRRR